jgi:hypothetical protein
MCNVFYVHQVVILSVCNSQPKFACCNFLIAAEQRSDWDSKEVRHQKSTSYFATP